jgi:hypothetical protein
MKRYGKKWLILQHKELRKKDPEMVRPYSKAEERNFNENSVYRSSPGRRE